MHCRAITAARLRVARLYLRQVTDASVACIAEGERVAVMLAVLGPDTVDDVALRTHRPDAPAIVDIWNFMIS